LNAADVFLVPIVQSILDLDQFMMLNSVKRLFIIDETQQTGPRKGIE